MITLEDWKLIYNNTFKLFPPPSSLEMNIYYKDKNKIHEFNSITEFLSYMCLCSNTIILNENIEYVLKNEEKEYKKLLKYIKDINKNEE